MPMKCRVSSCGSTLNVVCRHTLTGQFYCPRCARNINEHNYPGLVVFPQDNPMLKQLAAELNGIAETYPDGVGVHGKISRKAFDELMMITADRQPHEAPPVWAKGPKYPAIVWYFPDAPADLQDVASQGGDEEWIILSPDRDAIRSMFDKLERVDDWNEGKLQRVRYNALEQFMYVTQH